MTWLTPRTARHNSRSARSSQRITAFARPWLVAGLVMLAPASGYAQGSIAGRVTAAVSDAGLPDARVMVVGTSLVATTNAEGRYTLRNVPAGVFDVRVLRVGYQEQKKSITVAAAAVTLDFSMTEAVIKLQEVVTTATGEQRRVEIG